MFYSITGQVVYTDATSVAVSCGGVAFNCSATANTLKNIGTIGDTVMLYTYLNVREDVLDMFGFYDKDELDCFKLLINVTGVGPKAALAILSQLTPNRLAVCVASPYATIFFASCRVVVCSALTSGVFTPPQAGLTPGWNR